MKIMSLEHEEKTGLFMKSGSFLRENVGQKVIVYTFWLLKNIIHVSNWDIMKVGIQHEASPKAFYSGKVTQQIFASFLVAEEGIL